MEEPTTVPGTDGFYGVDKNGSIFSCHVKGLKSSQKGVWRKLKPSISKNGYPKFSIHLPDGSRKFKLVHQAVLESFVGP